MPGTVGSEINIGQPIIIDIADSHTAAYAHAAVIVPFAGSLGSPITGSQKLTAPQIAGLRSGLWSVNLHTSAFPAGELRGQVTAAQ